MTDRAPAHFASRCLCPLCCESPAPTYTEAWRRQCEARSVMRLERSERTAYYAAIASLRGRSSAEELVREVNAQHARVAAA